MNVESLSRLKKVKSDKSYEPSCVYVVSNYALLWWVFVNRYLRLSLMAWWLIGMIILMDDCLDG